MDIIKNGFVDIINFLYGVTSSIGFPSYAFAIIIMTLIVKVILFPLTLNQMTSMRKMQEIQPQVQKLQKKYQHDKEKMNAAVMELYQENKVNPTAGCLPLIIQMPILIGLFQALRDYQFTGDSSFLWVASLSDPDPYYILPVLVGVATFFQSKLSMGQNATGQQAFMLYGMPLFIAYISMRFPAGLGLYWVVFNSLGIVQQYFINRIHPPAEVPVKKGGRKK